MVAEVQPRHDALHRLHARPPRPLHRRGERLRTRPVLPHAQLSEGVHRDVLRDAITDTCSRPSCAGDQHVLIQAGVQTSADNGVCMRANSKRVLSSIKVGTPL